MSKSREVSFRRALHRRGLELRRCRRRDPAALGFGRYMIVDQADGFVVVGEGYTLTLAEAEAWAACAGPMLVRHPTPQPRLPKRGVVSLHVGDALAILRTLPPEHFSACITSPPYYRIRDNRHPDQIGLEETPQEYVRRLVRVFREVRRVLRADATCWVVIDDNYCTRRAIREDGRRSVSKNMNGTGVLPSWSEAAAAGRTVYSSRLKRAGLKEKDLMLVPQRLSIALQEDGWFVRSSIIWAKTHGSPDVARDRPAHGYETVLLLSKSPTYYFAGQHLMDEAVDGGQRWGRDIWFMPPSSYASSHTSAMPLELARRCIRAGAAPRTAIVDPFAGAGTSGLAAAELGRAATLIEISPEHAEVIRRRLGGVLT